MGRRRQQPCNPLDLAGRGLASDKLGGPSLARHATLRSLFYAPDTAEVVDVTGPRRCRG